MASLCSAHRHLNLDCKLCRSALPENLKLYLVVDTCCYVTSESIIATFFTREEAEAFHQKKNTEYNSYEIQELEFNIRNGQAS